MTRALRVFFYGGIGTGGFTYVNNLVRNPPEGIDFFFPKWLKHYTRDYGIPLRDDRLLPLLDVGLSSALLKVPGVKRASLGKWNLPVIRGLFFPPWQAPQTDVTFSFMKPLVHDKPWVFAFDHVSGHQWMGVPFARAARKLLQRVLAARHCKAILPMSEWALGLLRERVSDFPRLSHKASLLPPFPLPSQPPRNFARHRGPVKFLFSGRLFDRKGGPETLEAFERLCRETKDIELHLSGQPPEPLEDVRAQVGRLDAQARQRIHFHGRVSSGAQHALFRACDVYVMPARHECFGQLFTEAMNFSLPIIAARVDAVPEIVEDGKTGLLAPAQDVPSLHDAMAALARGDSLRKRMARAGKRRFEERFGSEPVHAAVRKILRQAAEK